MEWTEEAVAQLRALWADGLSTAEIGRRMGITKNAVVGKAHRLQLASRPSPIRRERRLEPIRLRRPAQADTPSAPEAAPSVAVVSIAPVVLPVPPRAAEAARPRAARPALSLASTATGGRVSPCCWPIGEPGTREFRFCDAATLAGKPYCAEHAQIAYVRIKDKRDAVA